MQTNQQQGFTLVELLLAVMILAGAISGILMLMTSSMISSRQAWDTTVATSHGEHVLEEMQRRETLDEILTNDWSQWAVEQRLNTLPEENIKVIFTDPGSDPLDIKVYVHWNNESRINQIAFRTQLTK
jgi:prepilin-type N-terminal cleavage/methylation domain-containing protein